MYRQGMTHITARIDDRTKQRMKDHPKVNWSEVIRQAIWDELARVSSARADALLMEVVEHDGNLGHIPAPDDDCLGDAIKEHLDPSSTSP